MTIIKLEIIAKATKVDCSENMSRRQLESKFTTKYASKTPIKLAPRPKKRKKYK